MAASKIQISTLYVFFKTLIYKNKLMPYKKSKALNFELLEAALQYKIGIN